ncbi:restriction endonuclease subunit S [Aliarcobacter butzleri]|uniref:restriction endonuclease subunit S n=1 Tax=Aliarcobacter butzleri TaxID=28197 RepID=UPI0024DE33B2|nr:restriction endonuclease subunit S [Aliarcobacter butzleri]MDK2090321.1 restriction endonuclease subunit S [Aliarcobacter butzleri]
MKKEIGEYIKILSGYPFNSDLFNEENIGKPLIRIRDLERSYSKTYFNGEYEKTYVISQGDILVGMDGDFNAVKWKGIDSLLNQRICKIETEENSLDKEFMYQSLQSELNKIHRKTAATTVKHLSTKDIKKIKIFFPLLEEQKKIADILSTVDKKIAFVEENINATEELKKGLMQKLLTEGIGHTEFKDSEIGRIPKSWEVKSIGSLTSLTAGGTPSTQIKDYWNPKEVPWLSSGEVNKKIIYFTDNMISKQGLNNSAAKFIPKYSVLIALAGQGKTRGTVAISEIELTTNQSVASILPSEKLDMYFIYYNLDSRYEEIRSMSTGVGGRGGLNLAILKSIKIALPPQKEQKQISEILSTVDKKLENLKEKKLFFQELKKGLMQKLLTGEVRV